MQKDIDNGISAREGLVKGSVKKKRERERGRVWMFSSIWYKWRLDYTMASTLGSDVIIFSIFRALLKSETALKIINQPINIIK